MSDYKCEACGKFKKPNTDNISPGDKVTFTVTTNTFRSVRMKSVTGKVVSFTDRGSLLVKSGKYTHLLNKSEVLPVDAPSSITYALFGTCECKGGAA
jgi:hypothetical protein